VPRVCRNAQTGARDWSTLTPVLTYSPIPCRTPSSVIWALTANGVAFLHGIGQGWTPSSLGAAP
jgi:hypothetical protein